MTTSRAMKYAHGDAPFAAWLSDVDRIVLRRCGLSLFDLPDAPLRDWYDDELTPAKAAVLALDNALDGLPLSI